MKSLTRPLWTQSHAAPLHARHGPVSLPRLHPLCASFREKSHLCSPYSPLLLLCMTSPENKPKQGGGSSPRDVYPLGEFHPCRSMRTRWCVEPPGAGASTSSSFPLPQTEGEHDQSQANHHREGTYERRQERHICTGQGCEDYAEEHRQGATSGQ